MNQKDYIKFSIKNYEYYGVTSDGRILNKKTGRWLRKTIIGTTIGYCINQKFKSLKYLRTQLIKNNDIFCPF